MKNKWLGYLILSPFILVAFVAMSVSDYMFKQLPKY